ncbi:DUF3048 domain-containing protein [Halobacillus litoralis]|uniref:DUF3048 domain-containing protein n=1 Tax=Halobacillus litoralis TaxID=45668 RepID=A0A845FAL5_9BACI|nr:DUF3048 domain-containing protein [Halobacillus litoralis]MYL71343.1 DUF3048 domain-containing protein [Halobacillus litoralis]
MRKLTFFSLLIVLLLTACNEEAGAVQPEDTKEKETAVEEQIETEENVIVDEKEETEQAYTEMFPLTGEPTADKADHRALSVMVNNHTKARPQSGLSQADIVYEILAEGQITRFLALFHSEIPDTIGPVRSARPYYFKIADGFDALYTYHGASMAINQQVASSGIDYLDGAMYDNNGWLFERSSDRSAPHNSYLLTEGVEQAAATKGYDAEGAPEALPFTEKDSFAGTPVDDVQITYGSRTNVRFTYDSENEQFLRSSDGEPTIDRLNEERVAVENVWILETDHQIIDGAGRRVIDLTSGGNGYLLQKGQMKEVEWKNVDGRLLPYKDGSALAFTPGKTWVNIIPGNAAVETE